MSLFSRIKHQANTSSRERKLRHFQSLYKDGQTVLDVGISNEAARSLPETTNYFLKNFQCDNQLYTGLSVEDIDGMDKLYPGKTFIQYSGGKFPFDDKQFGYSQMP